MQFLSTEKQQSYIKSLIKSFSEPLIVPIEALTKKEASDLIGFLKTKPTKLPVDNPNILRLFESEPVDDEEDLPF